MSRLFQLPMEMIPTAESWAAFLCKSRTISPRLPKAKRVAPVIRMFKTNLAISIKVLSVYWFPTLKRVGKGFAITLQSMWVHFRGRRKISVEVTSFYVID